MRSLGSFAKGRMDGWRVGLSFGLCSGNGKVFIKIMSLRTGRGVYILGIYIITFFLTSVALFGHRSLRLHSPTFLFLKIPLPLPLPYLQRCNLGYLQRCDIPSRKGIPVFLASPVGIKESALWSPSVPFWVHLVVVVDRIEVDIFGRRRWLVNGVIVGNHVLGGLDKGFELRFLLLVFSL